MSIFFNTYFNNKERLGKKGRRVEEREREREEEEEEKEVKKLVDIRRKKATDKECEK